MLVEPDLLKQVVELSSLSLSESKRSIQEVKGLVVCEKIASLAVLTIPNQLEDAGLRT